jgi:hypothetical protein
MGILIKPCFEKHVGNSTHLEEEKQFFSKSAALEAK